MREKEGTRPLFERRREDGVGVGGAAGRLVELGERERRAQFEAARALLLRDGDGGQEGFFRGRGVGGVALQQDFAARPMQFRFERAIAQCDRTSPALRRGSRRRGRDRPPGPRPRPAQSSRAHRKSGRSARAGDRRRDACPRARRQARRPQRSPNPRKTRRTLETWVRSCSRASRASSTAFCAARARSPRISSNSAECVSSKRERADMREAASRACSAVDQGYRALDFAERPQRNRRDKPWRRRRRHVRSERPDRRRGRAGTRRARVRDCRALPRTLRRTSG